MFKEKLSPARRQVFGEALKDIWVKGSQEAAAEQREYTTADYYRQIGGLGYKQVVNFTDPSGDTAQARLRQASRSLYTVGRSFVSSPARRLGRNTLQRRVQQ